MYSYKLKYHKYKLKYLQLKKSLFLYGGGDNTELKKCPATEIINVDIDANYDYESCHKNIPKENEKNKKHFGIGRDKGNELKLTVGGKEYYLDKILGENNGCVYLLSSKDAKGDLIESDLLIKIANQETYDPKDVGNIFNSIYNLINDMHKELNDNGKHIMTVCSYGKVVRPGKKDLYPYILFVKNGVPLDNIADYMYAYLIEKQQNIDSKTKYEIIVNNSDLAVVLKDFLGFMEKFNEKYVHFDIKVPNVTAIIKDNRITHYMLIDLDTARKLIPVGKNTPCIKCNDISTTAHIFPPEIFHFSSDTKYKIINSSDDYTKVDYMGILEIVLVTLSKFTYNLDSFLANTDNVFDRIMTELYPELSEKEKKNKTEAEKVEEVEEVDEAPESSVVIGQAIKIPSRPEVIGPDDIGIRDELGLQFLYQTVFGESGPQKTTGPIIFLLFKIMFILDIEYIINNIKNYENDIIALLFMKFLRHSDILSKDGKFRQDIIESNKGKLIQFRNKLIDGMKKLLYEKLLLFIDLKYANVAKHKDSIINTIINTLKLTPSQRAPVYSIAGML